MKHYKIWLDGGSKSNGKDVSCAYGSYLFLNDQTQKIFIKKLDHGTGLTSNDAEWLTLLAVLEMLQSAGKSNVELFMDSELIINQFNGKWRCKNARMIDYRIKAWAHLKDLKSKGIDLRLSWISGDDMKMMVGH